MGWGAFFLAIATPVVVRVLISLGFGLVTLTGLSVVEGQITSAVGTAWGGIPADTYQVLALGGWVDALAYWLSAFVTVVAWLAVSRIARVSS